MAFVALEDRGSVRWVTMSSPETKNAIPRAGWVELAEALEVFEVSERRALVITGEGGEFCAGADLGADFSGFGTAAANAEYMRLPNRAALALHRISKPTVAAVDGVAVGAGMNLALLSNYIVGFQVSWAGAFMGLVEAGVLGFGFGWTMARLINAVVGWQERVLIRRLERRLVFEAMEKEVS